MINGTLQEFVWGVIAKGEIRYGDVRRFQRHYLPDGITHDGELELLISLNARLVRADKAWTQWLVACVSDFVAKQRAAEPFGEVAEEVGRRLLAASKTKLGRRIAGRVQRELRQRQGLTPKPDQNRQGAKPNRNLPRTSQGGTSANAVTDGSRRLVKPRRCGARQISPRSRRRHHTVRREMSRGAIILTRAAHRSSLPSYSLAFQRSHLINFQSSPLSLALQPCL